MSTVKNIHLKGQLLNRTIKVIIEWKWKISYGTSAPAKNKAARFEKLPF